MEWTKALSVFLGALPILVTGHLTGYVINRVSPWTRIEAPRGVKAETWMRILSNADSSAGRWIGSLESLLVYALVLLDAKNAALGVGGWLAFKVASKWETWSNIVKIPEEVFDGADRLESLRARREWGYALYERFLIGTILNVLAGAVLASLVLQIWRAV